MGWKGPKGQDSTIRRARPLDPAPSSDSIPTAGIATAIQRGYTYFLAGISKTPLRSSASLGPTGDTRLRFREGDTTVEGNVDQFYPYIRENQTDPDRHYLSKPQNYFDRSLDDSGDKIRSFAKFVPTAELRRFLAKHAIFQRILSVRRSIVECGVFLGGVIMTWAHLSVIYEPFVHVRKIIGFDTFEGFVDIHDKDRADNEELAVKGGHYAPGLDDMNECIRIFDITRPIGHIPKIELVPGDATRTIPEFLQENQHLVVALLYLDFDLYEPTRVAIEQFLPRMPKGAVIAFDELNVKKWPGETLAVLETVGIRNLRIERLAYQPQISFAVLD
jgi:hypothetical protein